MYIDCDSQKLNGQDGSLLVLGAVIVSQEEMQKAIKQEEYDYRVVVAFEVIKSSKGDDGSNKLEDAFEILYERMGYYIKDKTDENSGIMIFSDQDRVENQKLRKKCRALMEGKGEHPNAKFKMNGGLNIQEESNGLKLAKDITKIAVNGLEDILIKKFDHENAKKFKALPFIEHKNGSILGCGIASHVPRDSNDKEILEEFFGHKFCSKKITD